MNQEQKNQQDENDFRQLMATKPGRRFMYDLLADCRVFQASYSPASDRQTSYNEGARSIGLKLLAKINELTPKEYAMMMAEHPENIVEQEVQDDG